ncbi:MAG: histidine phosphatase family protein [Acidimicrobiales bacterium]
MIVLVRHGQSTLNAEGRLAGRLDAPLTSLGEAQALAVAEAVRLLGAPSRVVASPLGRALQTAEAFGLPVEIDDRWIELDYGEYDGAKLEDVPPGLWRAWRADSEYAPPGGESLAAVGARVRDACGELSADHGPAPVVVVSHVSPIKAAVAWSLGVDDRVAWRTFLAPGSYSCIGVDARGPSLHAFNVTSHLPAG